MALNGAKLTGSASFKYQASLRWYDSDESHYAGFKSAATVTASLDYTLPTAGPAVNGYVLSSTTVGVLSWAQVSLSDGVTGTLPIANGGTNSTASDYSSVGSYKGVLFYDGTQFKSSSSVIINTVSSPYDLRVISTTGAGATIRVSAGDGECGIFTGVGTEDLVVEGDQVKLKCGEVTVVECNIITGTTYLGFFAATPVVKQAHIADADGTLADITTKFNTLLSKIESYGLLATS